MWVERIVTEVHVQPRQALPVQEMLDNFPEVLQQVAHFVCADHEQILAAEPLVVERLSTIARLRQRLGCDPQELIHEFDLLAQVLDGACLEWLRSYSAEPSPDSVVRVAGRLNRGPILLAEISIGAFFEEENAERSQAAKQLRDFADVLTHELNTPLGAAEGAALLLENDDMVSSSQERRRFAGLIQRNLRRARNVIGNMRELAGTRASQPGSGRWLPMGQVLGEVLAEIRQVVHAAGVRVEVEEPIPDIQVDASRVEIILLNLLSNAAKYSDPDRPYRWIRISFERRESDNLWWIRVSDNGVGIPVEHHPHIFQRFFRAHPDRAEGTGLGLAIVAEAVQQLGGEIEFESEPRKGSSFRFSLPTAEHNGTGGEGTGGTEAKE